MFAWKNSFAQMQMVRQPGFKRTFSGEDSEKKAKNLHSILSQNINQTIGRLSLLNAQSIFLSLAVVPY